MPVITQVQAPAQVTGTANPVVYTFASNPTAGNIVVVSGNNSAAGHIGISDSFGDSGGAKTAWAIATGLSDIPSVGSGRFYTLWWRVIGNSPSGNTVSVSDFDGSNIDVNAGEYSSSDSGTWVLDGTPVTSSGTSADPSGGLITTTGNAFIYCRFTTVSGTNPTAGAGYTRNFTGAAGTYREAQEWGEFDSVSNQATNWTFTANDWMIMAAAFKVQATSSPAIESGSTGFNGKGLQSARPRRSARRAFSRPFSR